jgi:hypothetical protein
LYTRGINAGGFSHYKNGIATEVYLVYPKVNSFMKLKKPQLLLLKFWVLFVGCEDKAIEPLHPFSVKEYSLNEMGLEDYPYKDLVIETLSLPKPEKWESTGLDKVMYLELMEKIVRVASDWVDGEGAVIDPYFKAEFGQTTPRFVSSAAILLHYGYINDLEPLVIRAMTYSCNRLAEAKGDSPDFWMRELTTAYTCLKPLVDEHIWKEWENLLKKVEPEKNYKVVDTTGENLGKLHNWAVYSSGGEFVREAAGLTSSANNFLDGSEFFDKYMAPQMAHFTKEGMYRDPNDPITYDITTRLQIANALAYGYGGPLKNQLNELLRRGGLTMLFFVSPDGFAPYGGRSGQFQFQEGIIAALSELEARRYKNTNIELAGAFKRQAHLSVLSMRRWIMDMEPLRHIKNGFKPETLHGTDGYGKYSVYALYCSSVLGLAALYADDEIKEFPTFSEKGGYILELFPAFHKIFASVKDSQIEIDTKGTVNHEPLGLGRFQVKGVPVELGLSMPFVKEPNYRVPNSLKAVENYAIGPIWFSGGQRYSLSNLSSTPEYNMVRHQENTDTVTFELDYRIQVPALTKVRQHYKLFSQNLIISTSVEDPLNSTDSLYFTVPLLVSNGISDSNIQESGGKVRVNYEGHDFTVHLDHESSYILGEELFANRNGIYRNLIIYKLGNEMQIHLELQ